MARIRLPIPLTLVTFSFLLFLVPTHLISAEYGNTILTVSTFLFGILAGFYIYVTTTDYTLLKEVAATETAAYISLFEQVRMYHPDALKELALHIDRLIRRSFDYSFIEYAQGTQSEYEIVKNSIVKLPYIPEKSSIHQNILDTLTGLTNARQQLTVLGTKTLSFFQWAVLCILAFLMIVTLYGLRDGGIFFDAVTVMISSAVIIVLLLIREVDHYTWNESTFGFYVFENVFNAIGELPYYPAEAIADGSVSPRETQYRLGTYVNGGPSQERVIEIKGRV